MFACIHVITSTIYTVEILFIGMWQVDLQLCISIVLPHSKHCSAELALGGPHTHTIGA